MVIATIALASPTLVGIGFSGCTTDAADPRNAEYDAAPVRRDASAVDGFPSEPHPSLDSGLDQPSCSKYCDTVMANCTGPYSQYKSHADCMAFCSHMPAGASSDRKVPSLGCHLYWAGNPARTDPGGSCLAAGPFGGGVCGDRCQAYCATVLSACPPDGGNAVFASQADCATACLEYTYRDAADPYDAGGEDPYGPATGDSLNCRLFHLRTAVKDPDNGCPLLRPGNGACQ